MADLVRMFRDAREYITPTLKQSAFTEKGMLTPIEFVQAGDQLILKCPTWSWQQGEEGKLRPYLPRDKQFLLIRGCLSQKRVTELNASSVHDRSVASEMAGEDWCAPDVVPPSASEAIGVDDAVLVDASDLDPATALTVGGASVSSSGSKRCDEYADMDMEDDSLALDESTAVPAAAPSSSSSFCAVVRSRRYDLSITYDNYYRTPRVWLFGYDENGSVLKPEAIFDDIMTDYAKKTVTIDPHPHLSRPHGTSEQRRSPPYLSHHYPKRQRPSTRASMVPRCFESSRRSTSAAACPWSTRTSSSSSNSSSPSSQPSNTTIRWTSKSAEVGASLCAARFLCHC